MDNLAKRLNDMACTANSVRSNDAVDALMMEAAIELVRLQTKVAELEDELYAALLNRHPDQNEF